MSFLKIKSIFRNQRERKDTCSTVNRIFRIRGKCESMKSGEIYLGGGRCARKRKKKGIGVGGRTLLHVMSGILTLCCR